MNNLPLPVPDMEKIEEGFRNQWHRQLLEQAEKQPATEKHWPTQPVEQCRGYDWPDNAI